MAALSDTDVVLWDVVQEHLDEAEFLFEQWIAAARSPRFSLELLQRTLEPRLIAHLDGLAAGGAAVAERVIWPTFADADEIDEARIVAAGLAALADPATPPARLLAVLQSKEAKVRVAVRKAFQLTARPDASEASRLALYETDSPTAHGELLAILTARRIDPGPIIAHLLDSPVDDVLCAALHAVAAAVGARDRHRQVVEACLFHASPPVCAAALRTGLTWNLESARRACREQAEAGAPGAILYWALSSGAAALPSLTAALSSPARRKPALFALGFTGRLEAVDACLPWLDDPDPAAARLAVEAIAGIAGLPLYEPPYASPPASDDDAAAGDGLPPLEADLATNLMPSAADLLPIPAAAPIRAWWQERRSSFAANRRYLNGEPVSPASLQAALARGSLRRSGPIAFELAIRSAGKTQLQALRLGYAKPALAEANAAALGAEPRWL